MLFRMIGVMCLIGGFFAFYDYGEKLVPLFTQFVSGTFDFFKIFTTLTSFFLGALALVWVGVRLIALRAFSNTWLYFAVLPVTVWLQDLYNLGTLFAMDKILSSSIVFFGIYALMVKIALFIHKHWYTPLSHEGMRHVGLEKPEKSVVWELRWVLISIVLITLLILHPAPIGTTLKMVVSPIVAIYNFVR